MTHDDKPLRFKFRTSRLPLIPKTLSEVKDYLSEKFPFSDEAFQPDPERFLKIGRPISGDRAVRFHAAEFRRNASGEYHYTGRTIRAVTFDLSEMAGATRAEMILYDPGAIPFAIAIVRSIGYDIPSLRASTDELWRELEGLSGQPKASEVEQARLPGRWDDTDMKLAKLQDLRLDAIRDRIRLAWTKACEQVGIDPKTARKHAPDLRSHWYDKSWGR
jgi:hypothetical protein